MTVCNAPAIELQSHHQRELRADFDGSRISTDGGALLLREIDDRLGIVSQVADCFRDYRHEGYIEHPLDALLRQRIFGLCLGYDDICDHDALRDDSLLAVACSRRDITGADRRRERDQGKPLAGHATLHRLELARPAKAGDMESVCSGDHKITFNLEAGQHLLIDLYAQQVGTKIPSEVILDLDATDSTIHGEQEGKWFNRYYDSHCYTPLYIFTGDGHVLWSELQTCDESANRNAVKAVTTIIERLRGREGWEHVRFIIRGDSGFGQDDLMTWCEGHDVAYIFGFPVNPRLKAEIADALDANLEQAEKTGERCATYHAFMYQTRESWSRARLVSAKAEALPARLIDGRRTAKKNPRYIVTHLPGLDIPDDSEVRYREWYCPRGEMENRIKEQQLCLFADRVSTSWIWSNQIRQWFSTLAYVLMHALRTTALRGTKLATALCSTIRDRLLKIAATIRITSRKIWIHFSSAHPSEPLFRRACRLLR